MNHFFPDPQLPPMVIVDDCEDDIFLLRHRLRAGGITNPVVTFTSATDALRCLADMPAQAKTPQLFFTDIKLAGASGFELIARLRATSRWDRMRIVVITSSNSSEDLDRALELRVDGYLIKFPPPEILAEFVHQGPWFAVPRRVEALNNALSA